MATSINPKEIEHFSKDSDHWWDESGPFAPLHKLNPVRVSYIRDQIEQHFNIKKGLKEPFKDLSIIDVGCGGGLICEPVARLGGKVTGVDADKNAIRVAKAHAKQSALNIEYLNKDIETIKSQHDVVLALEIVEHVNEVEEFILSCANLCKKDGLIIFSTLNRTAKSFAFGIIAAEYILRWVPQGTHEWKKFIRPSELVRMTRRAGAKEKSIKGLSFNPLEKSFELSDDTSINYFMSAEKL